MPRPNSAVITGSPIATAEPKVISRMMIAAMSPMPSVPTGAVWDSAATGPPTSTCSPSPPAARIGFDQGLGLRDGELVVVLVEYDVGVRRLAVSRDLLGTLVREGARDADDVSAVGDIGEDLLGPRLDVGRGDAGVGSDHDLHGVARSLREALLESLRGRLRLRSRLQVVLPELSSECAREGERGHQRQRPTRGRRDDACGSTSRRDVPASALLLALDGRPTCASAAV